MTHIQNGNASAYLTDILEKPGIESVTFKILNLRNTVWIQTYGVWKVDENNNPSLDVDFTTHTKDAVAINNTGKVVVCGTSTFTHKEYKGCPAILKDDIVEMIVDFEQKELRFKINGKDYGKAGEINPEYKYRFAVSMFFKDDAIQLLS